MEDLIWTFNEIQMETEKFVKVMQGDGRNKGTGLCKSLRKTKEDRSQDVSLFNAKCVLRQ
jgi:hypothetical protein